MGLWIFELNEVARAKVEELRELFSRELRNMKLEIVSVRKKIDEKLISLKSQGRPAPPPLPAPVVPVTAAPAAAAKLVPQPAPALASDRREDRGVPGSIGAGGTSVSAKP